MSPTYSICRDHGYLSGEQKICPVCGQKTEVYSRITGYYRPVQNWNDGKAQEYKDRRVYNIGHSVLKHTGPIPAPQDMNSVAQDAVKEAMAVPAETIAEVTQMDAPVQADAAKETAPAAAGQTQDQNVKEPVIAGTRILLFKTPTCPNCKAAGALLNKAGLEYTALNANEEKDLVGKYGIKQAPTLVVFNGDSFEKYRGVSDIKGWLMKK